jgi:hypothetical protein
MRALYQGQATITRADGYQVTADVTIWEDDAGMHSNWGGRAVIQSPHSLLTDLGSTCMIRWPVSDGGHMVGEFVPSAGQVIETMATYRLAGVGEVSKVPAEA